MSCGKRLERMPFQTSSVSRLAKLRIMTRYNALRHITQDVMGRQPLILPPLRGGPLLLPAGEGGAFPVMLAGHQNLFGAALPLP